jgi:hypothetical protein
MSAIIDSGLAAKKRIFSSRQCTQPCGHPIEHRALFGIQQPSDSEESHLIQTMVLRTGTDQTIRDIIFSLSSVLWIARDTRRRPLALLKSRNCCVQ